MSLLVYPTLLEKLKSKKFRDAFRSSSVRYRIALQARTLRKELFGTQQKLGEVLGKPANVISRLENPSYGRITIQTLLELAAAFDVGLVVKFSKFGELIEHSDDLSDEGLTVPTFSAELQADLQAAPPLNASALVTEESQPCDVEIGGSAINSMRHDIKPFASAADFIGGKPFVESAKLGSVPQLNPRSALTELRV